MYTTIVFRLNLLSPSACVPAAASVAPVSSPSIAAPGGTRVALGAFYSGEWGQRKPKTNAKKIVNRENHDVHSFCGLPSGGNSHQTAEFLCWDNCLEMIIIGIRRSPVNPNRG